LLGATWRRGRLEPPGLMTTSMPSRGSAGGWSDEADSICSRLMRETGCGKTEAAIAVGRALERFRGARVREFVALFAERDARRLLRAWHLDPMRTVGSSKAVRHEWGRP
jgi:hypothetical protein